MPFEVKIEVRKKSSSAPQVKVLNFSAAKVHGKTSTTIDQSERRKESRDEKTDVFGRERKEALSQLKVKPTVGEEAKEREKLKKNWCDNEKLDGTLDTRGNKSYVARYNAGRVGTNSRREYRAESSSYGVKDNARVRTKRGTQELA